MRYLCLFFFLTVTNWVIAQKYDFEKIDALLHEVDSTGPGVVIGVVKDQRLVYTSSRGMANLDYKIRLNTASNFRLSSTSKQFTAACILHLMDKKQLELNDPLAKFFPDFSPTLGKVTVQQLLNHTSGIRDFMSLMMIQGSQQVDFTSVFIGEDQDIMELMTKQQDLSFPSGTQNSYSNTNYWLLGQIVGRVSGKSLGTYAQEHIFSPLGMKNSGYDEAYGKVIPQRAAGYISECPDCDPLEYRFRSPSVGHDGVISSIEDLLLWENEFHEHRLLSDQCWTNMLRQGKLNSGEEIAYASGLIIETLNGEKLVKHSGQNPGFNSQILRFPDHQLSIIVLGNQTWYDANGYANRVAELFFPAKTDDQVSVGQEAPTAINLTTAEQAAFLSDYHFPETSEYRSIERIGTDLVYVRNNGPNSKLIPVAKNVLIFEDRPHIELILTADADGKKHLEWKDPGMGSMHASSYEKVHLSEAKKARYISPYVSTELGKIVEIKPMDGKLILFMGDRPMPLQATTKDEFVAMGMFTLKFSRNQSGDITGFRMDAPRAENILFAKVHSR
jgi:CubicO group peptidase (beta-lactamase class C family)